MRIREGVELFQLAFLGQLAVRLDQSRYAVKGGCNLRFFFGSPRLSEDLDMDVGNVAKPTLKRNVEQVLQGHQLQLMLSQSDVSITSFSSPKQTETTQRWKLALSVSGQDAHTKVEFSRRKLDDGRVLAKIAPILSSRYALPLSMASHYNRDTALQQKVGALLGRAQTQSRDIFDLDLLMAGSDLVLRVPRENREKAISAAMGIGFDTFKSQVLAYLEPEVQAQYDSPSLWEQMVLRVVYKLEKAG